jgi:uncharacterized membrane protein
VERSAEDVWAYAADILRHPEWMDVTGARILSGQGTEVGARAMERMKLGPRSIEVELEVAAAIPGERIAWRLIGGGPLAGEVSLDLEALDPARTRAVYSGWIGLTGPLRILEPLMAGEVRNGEAAELRHLKEKLEMAESMAAATA